MAALLAFFASAGACSPYPFEIAAVILLVAIVAAIALTLRPKRQTKVQKPEEQVAVRRADRVPLVKMAPDERQ